MTEPVLDSNGKPVDGTDPNKNVNDKGANGLDLSKVGDEDFNKIFDDPRIFKHDRFKNLLERAKQGDAAVEAKKKAEEETLLKQKKFEELAQLRERERDEMKSKFTSAVLDGHVRDGALKAGVSVANLGALLKLVDRTNVKLNEDGSVQGVEEAVKAVLEAYPVFKGEPGVTTIGSPTNPAGGTTTVKRFKLSQIQNAEFYRANEKDITEALKHNAVEDDVNKK